MQLHLQHDQQNRPEKQNIRNILKLFIEHLNWLNVQTFDFTYFSQNKTSTIPCNVMKLDTLFKVYNNPIGLIFTECFFLFSKTLILCTYAIFICTFCYFIDILPKKKRSRLILLQMIKFLEAYLSIILLIGRAVKHKFC